MFKRWFGRKETLEATAVRGVYYLCEHDGTPERQLKDELNQLFQSRTDPAKAYLAVVRYEDAPGPPGVALCVTGVALDERNGLVGQIGIVFARLFNIQQHLDILFPTPEEEVQLSKVCRPFFARR
jgi:hypothetical protein